MITDAAEVGVGDLVIAHWTSCRQIFAVPAEVAKVNARTVRVRLTADDASGYKSGTVITLPIPGTKLNHVELVESRAGRSGAEDIAEREAIAKERRDRKRKALTAELEEIERRYRRISGAIPMGQPILVGHHSERRHRKDIERMRKGTKRAAEIEQELRRLRK